jgi:membrane protease YdiL (CAAX protease family)
MGLSDRERFAPRWLLIAALLVALNDALLTRFYGLLPNLLDGNWNWQGKLLALAGSLTVALLPLFAWRRVGLTLAQAPGSLRAALPLVLVYCAFFVAVGLAFPDEGSASAEDIAFQLTLPGLEEEIFYRGILLFALYKAFAGRVRFVGVDWGWGALLSSILFGMTHAFGFSDGQFSFDALYMALTAFPALIAVWVRLRTGSLLLPVLMHNFGNTISMLV